MEQLTRVWEHERTQTERLCWAVVASDEFLREYVGKRFTLESQAGMPTGELPVVVLNHLGLRTRLKLAWRLVWHGTSWVGV